jgi:glycosyltransferase involved in cell wall biosynthesis
MNLINVMQVTDTLDAGGAERMAVSLANLLPRDRYKSYLCTTRREGALVELLASDVQRLRLSRHYRVDPFALRKLRKYIARQQIDILHAHGTSLFIAAIASLFPPYPKLVWHDHYGRYKFDDRPVWLYRLAAARVKRVISVNEQLVQWARTRLGMPTERVEYIPNFVTETEKAPWSASLPGKPGYRIVCVANLRPEKDHSTLIQSLKLVVQKFPLAHLLLIGADGDPKYVSRIRGEIVGNGLADHITLLGTRRDVSSILNQCDMGVLSSASEGLPLALLEYGAAGLASVATDVGQCSEVLDRGNCGLLVPSSSPEPLAAALSSLLQSRQLRQELGARAQRRVRERYSPAKALREICAMYESIVSSRCTPASPILYSATTAK